MRGGGGRRHLHPGVRAVAAGGAAGRGRAQEAARAAGGGGGARGGGETPVRGARALPPAPRGRNVGGASPRLRSLAPQKTKG